MSNLTSYIIADGGILYYLLFTTDTRYLATASVPGTHANGALVTLDKQVTDELTATTWARIPGYIPEAAVRSLLTNIELKYNLTIPIQ